MLINNQSNNNKAKQNPGNWIDLVDRLHAQCQGHRFNPGSRNSIHMLQVRACMPQLDSEAK